MQLPISARICSNVSEDLSRIVGGVEMSPKSDVEAGALAGGTLASEGTATVGVWYVAPAARGMRVDVSELRGVFGTDFLSGASPQSIRSMPISLR